MYSAFCAKHLFILDVNHEMDCRILCGWGPPNDGPQPLIMYQRYTCRERAVVFQINLFSRRENPRKREAQVHLSNVSFCVPPHIKVQGANIPPQSLFGKWRCAQLWQHNGGNYTTPNNLSNKNKKKKQMVWLKGGCYFLLLSATFCYFLLFSAILGVWIFFIFWPWFGLLLKGGEMRDS